jgi:hypothetical protein
MELAVTTVPVTTDTLKNGSSSAELDVIDAEMDEHVQLHPVQHVYSGTKTKRGRFLVTMATVT